MAATPDPVAGTTVLAPRVPPGVEATPNEAVVAAVTDGTPGVEAVLVSVDDARWAGDRSPRRCQNGAEAHDVAVAGVDHRVAPAVVAGREDARHRGDRLADEAVDAAEGSVVDDVPGVPPMTSSTVTDVAGSEPVLDRVTV